MNEARSALAKGQRFKTPYFSRTAKESAIRGVRSAAALLARPRLTGRLSQVLDENAGAGGRCCTGARSCAGGMRSEPRFTADVARRRPEPLC